jgi:hypothetical protein
MNLEDVSIAVKLHNILLNFCDNKTAYMYLEMVSKEGPEIAFANLGT